MIRALSRRTLLRGAGTAVALPFLDAMEAQAAQPVRFVTFFWPNGPRSTQWVPSSPTLDASNLGACMKDAFAPVAGKPDIIPYLNIVTNLDGNGSWKSGHACAMMACGHGTTDDHGNFGNWPTAATLDQLLAAKLGTTTRLPSLVVTAFNSPGTPGWTRLSWKDGGKPVSPYTNPKEIFSVLFGSGGGMPGAGNAAGLKLVARRKSLLDFVTGDAKALQMRLGPSDRARVEEHLTAVRELEKLVMAAPSSGAACVPTEPSGMASDDAMLKLIALALKCDQTRYASFMLDAASGQRGYPGDAGGDHDMSHDGSDASVIKRTNSKLAYLARLLRDLAAVPDGAGTLLDNTIVFSCSDVTDGKAHGRGSMPVVIAGRAGGALKSGRLVAAAKGTRLVDLHCSLLNYGGIPTDKYGLNGTGPLPGF